ncbi:MAG: histidine kinase [Planctomycetota bacterium]|nr:histidine kinase [Planctomycetota bacterium]
MSHDDTSDPSERLTNLAHLSSAVGHHVINAYSAIVSNAEILRLTARSNVPADPVALADLIIRTGVEASTVARRLIDYTRPVTQIGESPVALDALIAEVVEAHRGDSRSHFSWTVAPGAVPSIRGHVAQLRAMLGHLIRNAEEAMTGSGGTISLSTEMDDRGWIALEIGDTGPGMAPELVERAVEPFFTTKNGHMGVGLSISNGIWRRHRGTMALKSRPGEGTRVRLCVDPKEGGLPGLR